MLIDGTLKTSTLGISKKLTIRSTRRTQFSQKSTHESFVQIGSTDPDGADRQVAAVFCKILWLELSKLKNILSDLQVSEVTTF